MIIQILIVLIFLTLLIIQFKTSGLFVIVLAIIYILAIISFLIYENWNYLININLVIQDIPNKLQNFVDTNKSLIIFIAIFGIIYESIINLGKE